MTAEHYQGTPLRRFGHYRVTQTHRGEAPTWAVYDTRRGERLLFSFCKASADFAAERLATGRPLQTPDEATERSLRLYGSIYPSRFALYDHRYVVLGNGLDWINGGLAERDVTFLTDEGARAWEARHGAEREETNRRTREHNALMAQASALLGEAYEPEPEEPDRLAQYRAGTWPEVGERTRLYPGGEEYSRLAQLLRMDTAAVDPAWLDDARAACRLLLAHGTSDGGARDTVAMLRGWAARLAAKHGGEWEALA